jgi:hypothetical protein
MCSVELGAIEANPCSRVRVPAPPSDELALRPVERVLAPAEL